MIVANKYEVPDDCPKECLFYNDLEEYGQGSICIRCVVLNCKKIPGPDGEPFSLIEPEHYREDWAKEWVRFFKGETDYPELKLRIEESTTPA